VAVAFMVKYHNQSSSDLVIAMVKFSCYDHSIINRIYTSTFLLFWCKYIVFLYPRGNSCII